MPQAGGRVQRSAGSLWDPPTACGTRPLRVSPGTADIRVAWLHCIIQVSNSPAPEARCACSVTCDALWTARSGRAHQ